MMVSLQVKSNKMKKLIERIFDISYRHNLSHLSSCLTTISIIDEIYKQKTDEDIFILSNGHAGLALYVILEKYYNINAEQLLEKHGIHPGKDLNNKIYCSTGSLGSGLPIAVGHALANKNKKVYCIISDGECAEGSIWEALRFINVNNINNLEVYVNINGSSATEFLDQNYLIERLTSFLPRIIIRKTNCNEFDFLNGILGHYYVMKEKDYEKAICIINK